jgi:hypothetical protein
MSRTCQIGDLKVSGSCCFYFSHFGSNLSFLVDLLGLFYLSLLVGSLVSFACLLDLEVYRSLSVIPA